LSSLIQNQIKIALFYGGELLLKLQSRRRSASIAKGAMDVRVSDKDKCREKSAG
jgi:hypothetical protein